MMYTKLIATIFSVLIFCLLYHWRQNSNKHKKLNADICIIIISKHCRNEGSKLVDSPKGSFVMSGMLFLKCGKKETNCSARELMTYDWEGWTPSDSVLLQWRIGVHAVCAKGGTSFGRHWRLQTLYSSVYPGRNLPQHSQFT